jgi:hypothetical protein
MINRWRGSDSSDMWGCIFGLAVGTVGLPALTYILVPYAVLIEKTPLLFWTAMLTPFAAWVLFQIALSLYAALVIRPVPQRDWLRTVIAGVVILGTGMTTVGPWLAFVVYGILYGSRGPVY